MILAPLGSVRIRSIHITERHSAVTIVCDESVQLDEWLWNTDRIHKGKALGNRFRLVIDGVTVNARRVFARYLHREPGQILTVTTGPGDTRAAAIGRRVGKVAHEVKLVRVKGDGKQRRLPGTEPDGPKRVTVEIESTAGRASRS